MMPNYNGAWRMDWWDFLAQQPEDGGCVLDAATFAAQLRGNRRGAAGGASALTEMLCHDDGYWCLVCGRFLPACDGVIVHDNVPHPEMTFDEEERPQ